MGFRDYKSPGLMISALLNERGWSKRTLSVISEINETAINKIASNKRRIDGATAIIFEDIFEIPAEDFLFVQKTYDLAVARIGTASDPERKLRANLIGNLPISEMIKRGWLDAQSVKDLDNVERSLKGFFQVNRLEDIETLPHAAKKTEVSIDATPAQLAWLYRVRTLATDMLVGKYSERSAKDAISKIKNLLHHPEELRKVPRILSEAGIRFVIVEALPSTKIDGVCFWLDEKSPVIGMSIRFDRIDNFVFVLRHELEHVLNKDGMATMMLDVDVRSSEVSYGSECIEQQEAKANSAASEFCVPSKMMDAFISRKSPFFAKRDIIGFSKMINVHAGIIVGQLQHKTGKFNIAREFLVPIRKIVTPNALTDGWGDIAPVD